MVGEEEREEGRKEEKMALPMVSYNTGLGLYLPGCPIAEKRLRWHFLRCSIIKTEGNFIFPMIPYVRDWRLGVHFPWCLAAGFEARTASPMRPYGRNWRLGLHLPWIHCSGDQGLEIHVPRCPTVDIEARDEFLIIFFTRTYDQDLIINGSPVFVQGSQLQEVKPV